MRQEVLSCNEAIQALGTHALCEDFAHWDATNIGVSSWAPFVSLTNPEVSSNNCETREVGGLPSGVSG